MSESVSLPALGESVTEGTVTRWLKSVGDRVEVDEPLLEVSTDKVDTEIPSPIAGVVEAILVAEDETVEVGTALVTIGTGEAPAEAAPAAPAAEAAPAPEAPAEAPAPAAESAPAPEAAPAPPAAEAAPAPAPQAAPEPPAAVAPDAAPQSQWAPPAEGTVAPAAEAPAPPAYAAPAPEASAYEQPAAEQPAAEQPAAEPVYAPPAERPADAAPADPAVVSEVPSTEAPAPTEAPAAEAPAAEAPATEAPAPAEAPAAEAAPAEAPAAAPEPAAAAPAAQPADEEAPAAAAAGGLASAHAGYVTPIVRKLANEKGIDLDSLTGTGVGGRIRKQDVLAAAEAPAPAAEAPATEAPAAPAAAPQVTTSELRGTTVPMSRLRKVVAERAVVSMQSMAQLTTVVEVDVTKVASFRDEVKADFQAKTGNKLTFLPFFTLAAAEALKAYPIINATIDGESIVYPDHENISMAVDTERGLLTPVIRNAGDLDLAGLAGQIADLAARTRDNKLKPDELAGGTFTVTNTGSRGALFDTPVVFLPQVAILGTGIVQKKPVVVSDGGLDAIAIRSVVFLALSYDHRIVDGADAARFLTTIKSRLEGGDFAGVLGI